MRSPIIFISAGEASGDTHGAGVIRELKARYPEATFFGIGGDRMQEAGVELIEHAGRMSFMGFAEVVRHLPFILATRTRVLAEIVTRQPDLILLIDYPGFHFSLLRRLKKMRQVYRPKILYYIAPQVWAWKAGRAKELAEMADRIATIFPFEPEIFEREVNKSEIRNPSQKTHSKQRRGAEILQPEDGLQDDKSGGNGLQDDKSGGGDSGQVRTPASAKSSASSLIPHPSSLARFVGHPLLDEVGDIRPRGEFFKSVGLEPDDRVVGLFPGSRKQEIRRHLPLLVKTVKLLRMFQPNLKFILAEAPGVPLSLYTRLLRGSFTPPYPPAKAGGEIIRVSGVSHEVLAHCNASIVKSGSTTIEAAYFGNPFVVFYKVTPLSYALGKRIIKVPFIAMANILAGEMVVRELIQGKATPENLFAEMLPLLSVPAEIEKCRAGLRKVREKLGDPGAARRVAEMASELLESK